VIAIKKNNKMIKVIGSAKIQKHLNVMMDLLLELNIVGTNAIKNKVVIVILLVQVLLKILGILIV